MVLLIPSALWISVFSSGKVSEKRDYGIYKNRYTDCKLCPIVQYYMQIILLEIQEPRLDFRLLSRWSPVFVPRREFVGKSAGSFSRQRLVIEPSENLDDKQPRLQTGMLLSGFVTESSTVFQRNVQTKLIRNSEEFDRYSFN